MQLPLLISRKGSSTFIGIRFPVSIRSINILAVIMPRSSIGIWMVVSMGVVYWHVSISSMPMTDSSSGTRRPSSLAAFIAPMAVRSLAQNRAVISLPDGSPVAAFCRKRGIDNMLPVQGQGELG